MLKLVQKTVCIMQHRFVLLFSLNKLFIFWISNHVIIIVTNLINIEMFYWYIGTQSNMIIYFMLYVIFFNVKSKKLSIELTLNFRAPLKLSGDKAIKVFRMWSSQTNDEIRVKGMYQNVQYTILLPLWKMDGSIRSWGTKESRAH